MITDKLKNISLYSLIPDSAIKFISSLSESTKAGKYTISDNIYANIEEYNTKEIADAKFEAHKKYIDIQFLLAGEERIFYSDIDLLETQIPYDIEKDIIFYKNEVRNNQYIMLNGTNFVMLYPHEAHAPQVISCNKSERVKKVVIKIKI